MSQFGKTQGPRCFGTAPRKSFFDGGDQSIPGPGAHSPLRMDKIQNPEWGLGTSNDRNSFTQPFKVQYPSPDHYKPHHQSIEKASPKYSFPHAKNPKSIQNFTTIYHPSLEAVGRQQPSFSFGYAMGSNYQTPVPGVGSYEILERKSALNKTQNHFSTGNRPLPYGEEARFPGPGNYHSVDLSNAVKFSFPKAKRSESRSRDPPAKFYDIGPKKKVPRSNRIFDIREKKRQTQIFQHNQNPAPNHYNTILPARISNGVIQYSKRQPVQNVAITKYPSPEKYTGQQILPKNKKGYTFTKNARSLSVPENMVPPPGAYEPMKTLSTIGGAMGKQKDKTQHDPTPAGTDYRPKYHLTTLKGRSPVLLRGDRCDFSKTITGSIGPGEYSVEKNASKTELGRIGRSERNSMNEFNKNPGVGNYNIPSFIGRLPTYYTSPKKVTENGFSTFHEKLRMKMQQRQRIKGLEKGQKSIDQGKSSEKGKEESHN